MKAAHEEGRRPSKSGKAKSEISRVGRAMHCTRCKQEGHYKNNCKVEDAHLLHDSIVSCAFKIFLG